MQSWCFSHNLEFNTDIDLCLHRTMGSKKTSWIYYSTCAVQVLKDNGKQWPKQSSGLSLAVGRRQQQKLILWATGRIWPCCTCRSCRSSEQLQGSAKLIQECESYQEEGVLEIWEPFCSVLITEIAANISYWDQGLTGVDIEEMISETASSRELNSKWMQLP